jgi:hypothetical protein
MRVNSFVDMKEFITNLLSDKPHIGIIASMSGATAALLSWLHVVTIVFGLVGAFFGAAAGLYTFLIKRREWKNSK